MSKALADYGCQWGPKMRNENTKVNQHKGHALNSQGSDITDENVHLVQMLKCKLWRLYSAVSIGCLFSVCHTFRRQELISEICPSSPSLHCWWESEFITQGLVCTDDGRVSSLVRGLYSKMSSGDYRKTDCEGDWSLERQREKRIERFWERGRQRDKGIEIFWERERQREERI